MTEASTALVWEPDHISRYNDCIELMYLLRPVYRPQIHQFTTVFGLFSEMSSPEQVRFARLHARQDEQDAEGIPESSRPAAQAAGKTDAISAV